MEQPCYKCGQLVEEGIAFCPHCSAPQIRVVVAEPEPAPAFAGTAVATVAEHSATLPASQTVPVLAVPMRWSQAAKPCALAALVASVLTTLGLNPFVAMLSVGLLSVIFYRQSQPGARTTAWMGARLGAIAGLIWFALSSIAGALVIVLLHKGPELRSEMLKKLEEVSTGANDPQVIAMFEYFKTPSGLMMIIVLSIIVVFLSALIFGSLGGVLSAAIFGRNDKR
jgi:hypothetical protein